MKKYIDNKPQWEISFGFYPGALIGIRTYLTPNSTDHVIYFPFVDICLTVYKYD